jgi:hypothetical protein
MSLQGVVCYTVSSCEVVPQVQICPLSRVQSHAVLTVTLSLHECIPSAHGSNETAWFACAPDSSLKEAHDDASAVTICMSTDYDIYCCSYYLD